MRAWREMVRRVVVAVAVSATAASPVHAQGAADTAAAPEPADTAALLAALDAAVRRDGRDAAAWHRRGMLAWARVRPRMRVGFMRSQADISLLRLADSSLRRAAAQAPDSARYLVDLGRYFLSANLITLRAQSYGLFERALAAARRRGDAALVAEAADELGMVYWRRYEAVADRQNVSVVQGLDLDRYAFGDGRELREALASLTWRTGEWSGQADYLRATDLFAEAARAAPGHPRALRHAFMALAERGRWEELRLAAVRRLDAAPWDAQGWLARGLAAHRLNDERDAAAAFDSALALLAPADRERYTRLSRILRPTSRDTAATDSARFAALPAERRAGVERLYWLLADPLALTPENEHRLEFLARVAYAELRWTSDDFGLRGADTDRGDVWVRYGPPALVAGFPPENGVSSLLWLYASGVAFVFRTPPTYGTATFAGDYAERARTERARAPVRWDNLELNRRIDTVAVQVARFRGPGDSTDVVLVADVPVDSLLAGVDVTRAALDVDMRVYGADAVVVARDSTHTLVDTRASDLPRTRAWRRRLAPGPHVYRVEALQPDALRAARAVGSVRVAGAESGLAMSDVLLAARVLPRAGDQSGGDAARWSDFNVAPSAGRFRRGERVALLWETYALGAEGGASRYRVAVTVERERRRGGAAAFAARVVSGAAGAVGASARGSGRVTLAYDREVPARSMAVDHLTLDLGDAAAGRYRLSVEVTDRVTARRTRRESTITILE